MSSSILANGKDAIADFVNASLLPEVTDPNGAPVINLERKFRDYLMQKGASSGMADEHAERWKSQLATYVYERVTEWESLGLPRPLDLNNNSKVLLTCRHPKYTELTGLESLPHEFGSIYGWIATLSEREFLFVCACFLKAIGCTEIYITDASGDGGIDVVGKISNGPLRSFCFFVQSKTSSSWIPRETVLLEYGKFQATKASSMFSEYKTICFAELVSDGAAFVYLFLTNNEFKDAARRASKDLGILLRSRRQLAFWLAQRSSLAKLQAARARIGGQLEKDLTRNLASAIVL